MIENANRPGSGGALASVVGFLLLLLLVAAGVFGQRQWP
jgi:hypothetical protein